ncbi:MAG: ubiquitin-like domain-containing protein [Candidatus Helarchaeota archaeon]
MEKKAVTSVRVRMTDGNEERFILPKDAKIIELKKMIQQRRKIPIDRQRLIYGGNVINDDDSLKTIKFQQDGVIFCVVRSIAGNKF